MGRDDNRKPDRDNRAVVPVKKGEPKTEGEIKKDDSEKNRPFAYLSKLSDRFELVANCVICGGSAYYVIIRVVRRRELAALAEYFFCTFFMIRMNSYRYAAAGRDEPRYWHNCDFSRLEQLFG